MNQRDKWKRVRNLDRRTKLLFIEAFFCLGLARIAVLLPFRWIAPYLGDENRETLLQENDKDRTRLEQIQTVVRMAGNHTLWKSNCLTRALAAMIMLHRRRLSSTLYLGTGKDEQGKLIAHAWLRSGSLFVTGADEMEAFTTVSSFAKNRHVHLDQTRLSQELNVLLQVLQQTTPIDTAIVQTIFTHWSSGNWHHFLKLAQHHRVYPVLYGRMKALDEQGVPIPDFVLDALQQAYEANTFQMMRLCSEMTQVSHVLSEHNIRAIFLKGPVVAACLYENLSLRTSCDLDLLIAIDDLPEVETILAGLGYTKDDYIRTVLGDWRWRHHHMTFMHPQRGIKVEIHWRLHPGPTSAPDFEPLWQRKRTSKITEDPVYLLGAEDLFMFLVMHGARHGWSRLRWLLDIEQMLIAGLDWQTVKARMRRYQCLQIGGQAVLLANQLLHTPIDDPELAWTRNRKSERLCKDIAFYLQRFVRLHANHVPDEVSKYHQHYLFRLMAPRQKLVFLLSFLYPYPEDVKTLPLPKKFHFLYFLLRPFLWAWRKRRTI